MTITVLGVPDSAGAYCVGVERAPTALREAGLVEALTAGGNIVHDAGDLTTRRWAPDRESPFAQNLGTEVEAVSELADAAAPLLAAAAGDDDGGTAARSKVLVLGGSCLVAVGMCAAISRAGGRPRLVYIDRHLDLNTPSSTEEGSLSWMGMGHALGVEGAAAELAAVAGRAPLLDPADLAYLGVDTAQATDGERQSVEELGLSITTQAQLVSNPAAAARIAADSLPAGPFVVHLDVDVLDFLDAPLAENVNGRNSGPSIAQLEPALRELWSDPDCLGLSIGQLVPAHAESDPTVLPRFVAMLAAATSAAH